MKFTYKLNKLLKTNKKNPKPTPTFLLEFEISLQPPPFEQSPKETYFLTIMVHYCLMRVHSDLQSKKKSFGHGFRNKEVNIKKMCKIVFHFKKALNWSELYHTVLILMPFHRQVYIMCWRRCTYTQTRNTYTEFCPDWCIFIKLLA